MSDSLPEINVVEISAAADVALVTDIPFPTRFMVQSIFLANASPVFKSMLSGHFSEGQCLAESGFVTIQIHDDFDETLEILLNVIHLCHERVPKELEPSYLYEVAVLCDKYMCHSSVMFSTEVWFDSAVKKYKDFESRGYLAAAAAALGKHAVSKKLTAALAFEHARPLTDLSRKDMPLLDAHALLLLEEQRRDARKIFRLAFEYLKTSKVFCDCTNSADALPRVLEIMTKLQDRPLGDSWTALGALIGDDGFLKMRYCLRCHGLLESCRGLNKAEQVRQDSMKWMQSKSPICPGVCLVCLKGQPHTTSCIEDGNK